MKLQGYPLAQGLRKSDNTNQYVKIAYEGTDFYLRKSPIYVPIKYTVQAFYLI